MKLYVLRHGEAEPYVATDQSRPLTERGRDDVRRVIKSVQEELRGMAVVLASPYLRAQQTADIACESIVPLQRESRAELVPETALTDFFNMLQQRDERNVLLVSHQPLVGRVVEQMCGNFAAEYAMSTANLVRIDCDYPAPGCGTFRWIKRVAD